MAMITRLSRLFRADFHAVLDRIEEPDILLRQAVREMEEELIRDQQRSRLMNHECGQLVAREADLDHSLNDIDEELNVCFENGKDDLARALIKRKLEAQRLIKFLARKRKGLEEELRVLDVRIKENGAQVDSMRQKLELLSEDDASVYTEEFCPSTEIVVRDEEVEVAFLRERQRRQQS